MRTGDVVPDFELPDQSGTPRTLSSLLANGPVPAQEARRVTRAATDKRVTRTVGKTE